MKIDYLEVLSAIVGRIEKSLRDRHPEVKFKTLYFDNNNEYFIYVDKAFLDSEEGKDWFLWLRDWCCDICITDIFIVPWLEPDKNPDEEPESK